MCSSSRIGNMTVSPGSHLITHSKKGTNYVQWGWGKEGLDQYNARCDKLDTLYKNFDRVYAEFTAFYEGKALFYLPPFKVLKLAGVEDERGVLILTRSSYGTIVEPFHQRMPIVLEDGGSFTRFGKIVEINYSLLKIA